MFVVVQNIDEDIVFPYGLVIAQEIVVHMHSLNLWLMVWE